MHILHVWLHVENASELIMYLFRPQWGIFFLLVLCCTCSWDTVPLIFVLHWPFLSLTFPIPFRVVKPWSHSLGLVVGLVGLVHLLLVGDLLVLVLVLLLLFLLLVFLLFFWVKTPDEKSQQLSWGIGPKKQWELICCQPAILYVAI